MKSVNIHDLTNAADEAKTDLVMRGIAQTLTGLKQILTAAREEQWQAPNVKPSNDHPPRPTEDIALDSRRLKLRVAVINAESVLDQFHAALEQSREEILAALSAYTDS